MDPWPRRIVCLTEETTETLYRLGEAQRIVGISGFTARPPEARREKPKVAAFTSAKHSRILELEPDLVLGFSDLQADIEAVERTLDEVIADFDACVDLDDEATFNNGVLEVRLDRAEDSADIDLR